MGELNCQKTTRRYAYAPSSSADGTSKRCGNQPKNVVLADGNNPTGDPICYFWSHDGKMDSSCEDEWARYRISLLSQWSRSMGTSSRSVKAVSILSYSRCGY